MSIFNANKKIDLNTKSYTSESFLEAYHSTLGLGQNDKLIFDKHLKLKSHSVSKYSQTYKKIPVFGSQYMLHHKDDKLIKATGALLPKIDISIDHSRFRQVDNLELYEQLTHSFKTYDYPYIPEFELLHFKNHGLRIIDKVFPGFSGDYKLCYLIKVHSHGDTDEIHEKVFVDAYTGQLISHFSEVHFHNVKGTGETKYYGVQEISFDSLAPDQYLLQDYSRGEGVVTVNADREVFEHNDKHWNLNSENQDQIAIDAHYCTTAFYDLMNERYGWSGIDGIGGELVSRVQVNGKFYVNAYWDGRSANFGNGDCDRYSPLTTLAIVGHEFMHGVTDYTSDLVYRNESGALNESMSDIFGKALEFYYDPDNFNWLLGDIIRQNEDVNPIRSMEDPTVRNDPKFYGGEFWYEGTGDNGGVHTNSGVLNYWFYLLVEGGQVENELLDTYTIESIGMDDAIDICFQMQAAYLTTGSNYFDALYASIESCNDLFGENSHQLEQVLKAWRVVGLYPGFNNRDLSIEGELPFIVLCPGEEFYPSCHIINRGLSRLSSGDTLSVLFSQVSTESSIEEIFVLSDDLMPGDTILYQFSQKMINEESENGSYHLHVSIIDEPNQLNNLYRGNFRTSSIEGLDLFLETVEFSYNQPCVADEYNRFQYRLRNIGCQVVEVDDTLTFLVETELGDFQINRRVFFPIEPGDLQAGSMGLNTVTLPGNFEEYTVTILQNGDIDQSNNIASGATKKRTQISNGYIERFDNGISDSDFSISGSDYYNTHQILEIEGNNMLAFWGLRDHSFFRNCALDKDFFDQYNFKSLMSYCVDVGNLDQPVFEFNLMQFKNELGIAEPLDPEFTSMVEVELADTSYLFYGQGDSHFINHKIDLPERYVGQLDIRILTLGQNEIIDNSGPTELKDMVLLDDIRLHHSYSRNAIFDESGYTVYPNPTVDIIRIAHEDNTRIFDVRIFDTSGKLVLEKSNIINQHWFDISNISDGMYIIQFDDNINQSVSMKLVKLAQF